MGAFAALGIAFGWLIEFIQENFIHLRFYDLDDVIANGIGTILGAAAYWLMCRKITKMKRSA